MNAYALPVFRYPAAVIISKEEMKAHWDFTLGRKKEAEDQCKMLAHYIKMLKTLELHVLYVSFSSNIHFTNPCVLFLNEVTE